MYSKTLTLQNSWVETQQRYDVSEPNVDVTQVSKVVGVADECSGRVAVTGVGYGANVVEFPKAYRWQIVRGRNKEMIIRNNA